MYLVFDFNTRVEKKLTYERLSFETQLKIAFLWPYTRHKKVSESISGLSTYGVERVPASGVLLRSRDKSYIMFLLTEDLWVLK